MDRRIKILSRYVLRALLAAAVLSASGCPDRGAKRYQAEQYLVGANYYLWFPSNFGDGRCLRQVLVPAQLPVLGYYDSADTAVVEQHIAWCSRYGIDFLTMDWWPGETERNDRIMRGFLAAGNIEDIKFCIFYESWTLGFDSNLGNTEFNEKTGARFVEELLDVADRFFDHPSYLRVDDRPVIVLYLTRTFSGDYEAAVKDLRAAMKKRGYDPFLVGDEVFWKVTPVVEEGQAPYPLVTEPQRSRIACFDAVTGYNMYESRMSGHKGYGIDSSHIEDVAAKYREYRDVAGDTCFVPTVIPGYNDRGERPTVDHYVIPRQWEQGGEEGSFFAESFNCLALPFADAGLNMIMITSWNEWNEDTAIEPVAPCEPTSRDITGEGYTQGYEYAGYGTRYLEIVRDKVVAICGRVVDKTGEPVPGREVTATSKDVTICGTTDHDGYYRVSRLNVAAGTWRVSVEGAEAKDVAVAASGATTGVNFTCSARSVSGCSPAMP